MRVTPMTTIVVGALPDGIAVTPDGAKVFVNNANGYSLSIIDTTNNQVTNTLTKDAIFPEGIAIMPAPHSTLDAGISKCDASTATDASSTDDGAATDASSSDDAGTEASTSSGCSCRASGAGATDGAGFAFAALVSFVAFRRSTRAYSGRRGIMRRTR